MAAPFLSDRLRDLGQSDVFDNDPKRTAKMLADLDSEDFENARQCEQGAEDTRQAVRTRTKRKALDANPSAR